MSINNLKTYGNAVMFFTKKQNVDGSVNGLEIQLINKKLSSVYLIQNPIRATPQVLHDDGMFGKV